MDPSILSEALRAQATTLAGELAWPASAVRAAVEELCDRALAIVGVELWVPAGDVPRVLDWSDYEVAFAGDWGRFVRENARLALAMVYSAEASGRLPSDGLFNLTWMDLDDYSATDGGV